MLGLRPLGSAARGSDTAQTWSSSTPPQGWLGNSVAVRIERKTTFLRKPNLAIGLAGVIQRKTVIRKVEIPGGSYNFLAVPVAGIPIVGAYLPVASEPVDGSGLGPITLEANTEGLLRFSFKTRLTRRPQPKLGRAGVITKTKELRRLEFNSNQIFKPAIAPTTPQVSLAAMARAARPVWTRVTQLRRADWMEISRPAMWAKKNVLYGRVRTNIGSSPDIGNSSVYVTTGYLEAWGPPPTTNVFVTTGYFELWGSPTAASAVTASARVGGAARAAAARTIKQFGQVQINAKSRVQGMLTSAATTIIGFCRVNSRATVVAVGTNIMRFFATVKAASRSAQDVQHILSYQHGRVTASGRSGSTPTIIGPTFGHYDTSSKSWVQSTPHVATPKPRISQLPLEVAAVAGSGNARVSQTALEVAGTGSKARVSQTALEVAAVGSKARISQLGLEVAGALEGEARVSQLVLEVLLYDYYQPGPPDIYPNFPILSYAVMKSAMFFNLPTQTGQAGKDFRFSGSAVPRWKFDLTYGGLRDTVQFREYALMLGFFYKRNATLGYFLFRDPDDNQVESQFIATTYATSPVIDTLYTLKRTYCGITEPIGYLDTTNPFNVYMDGVQVDSSRYYIMQDIVGNQLLKFKDTPPPGKVITVDMSYFYAVRFANPSMDLEQFVHTFYQAKQVSLISLRSNNPLNLVP